MPDPRRLWLYCALFQGKVAYTNELSRDLCHFHGGEVLPPLARAKLEARGLEPGNTLPDSTLPLAASRRFAFP